MNVNRSQPSRSTHSGNPPAGGQVVVNVAPPSSGTPSRRTATFETMSEPSRSRSEPCLSYDGYKEPLLYGTAATACLTVVGYGFYKLIEGSVQNVESNKIDAKPVDPEERGSGGYGVLYIISGLILLIMTGSVALIRGIAGRDRR